VQDAATGLVNLRARMYSPATGQFLTRVYSALRNGLMHTFDA